MNARLGLLLAIAALSLLLPGSLSAQETSGALQQAIDLFEQGEHDESARQLRQLLAENRPVHERSVIRNYLAWLHMLRSEPDQARDVWKELLADDPTFRTTGLALPGAEVTVDIIQVFSHAALELRQDEIDRRMAALERTSRSHVLLRSALLPGLGQRYQGYRGKSLTMMGLAAGTIIYAIVADRSYKSAREDYQDAGEGAEFDQLYTEFTDKSDSADIALGIVAAAWGVNLLDALMSGPNLAGLEQAGLQITPRRQSKGLQLALMKRF